MRELAVLYILLVTFLLSQHRLSSQLCEELDIISVICAPTCCRMIVMLSVTMSESSMAAWPTATEYRYSGVLLFSDRWEHSLMRLLHTRVQQIGRCLRFISRQVYRSPEHADGTRIG
jgi:hypothetical protein